MKSAPSRRDRLRHIVADLRMPGALEALDAILQGVDGGALTGPEAIEQLLMSTYDLVITDLGRRWSSDASQDAGRHLLMHPAIRNGGPPVVVYAGKKAVKQRDELLEMGAFGVSVSRWPLRVTARAARSMVRGPTTTVGSPVEARD